MTGSYMEIPMADGGRMPAYFVDGSGIGSHAGLVVLQEIFGVNASMRQAAEAFATLGYRVIVPDLFWRQQARIELDPASATDRERATALMKDLDQARAVDDALAAAAILRKSVKGPVKIGAVGYCLGGKLAFLIATRSGISAAVSYYGVAIEAVLNRADELDAPMLLHLAMEDALCPAKSQAAIHSALDSRPGVEIIDHPGVGHAFARRGGAAFNPEAANKADAATAAFFSRHLDSHA
jgi:carboxymethylenebutenolidase